MVSWDKWLFPLNQIVDIASRTFPNLAESLLQLLVFGLKMALTEPLDRGEIRVVCSSVERGFKYFRVECGVGHVHHVLDVVASPVGPILELGGVFSASIS